MWHVKSSHGATSPCGRLKAGHICKRRLSAARGETHAPSARNRHGYRFSNRTVACRGWVEWREEEKTATATKAIRGQQCRVWGRAEGRRRFFWERSAPDSTLGRGFPVRGKREGRNAMRLNTHVVLRRSCEVNCEAYRIALLFRRRGGASARTRSRRWHHRADADGRAAPIVRGSLTTVVRRCT